VRSNSGGNQVPMLVLPLSELILQLAEEASSHQGVCSPDLDEGADVGAELLAGIRAGQVRVDELAPGGGIHVGPDLQRDAGLVGYRRVNGRCRRASVELPVL
jgi:hypothetical protein